MKVLKLFYAISISLLLSMNVSGSVITMASAPQQSDYEWQNESVGNLFSVNEDIWVTSLGIWDEGLDGLSNDYRVVLFDTSQNPLASADVSSGVTSRLEDGSRWSDLASSVLLSAGNNYFIATYRPNFDDLFQWVDGSNVQIASEVTLLDDRYIGGNAGDGLTPIYPIYSEVRNGIFGPNIQFVTSVPEPASLTLLGLGLAGLGFARRKKAV